MIPPTLKLPEFLLAAWNSRPPAETSYLLRRLDDGKPCIPTNAVTLVTGNPTSADLFELATELAAATVSPNYRVWRGYETRGHGCEQNHHVWLTAKTILLAPNENARGAYEISRDALAKMELGDVPVTFSLNVVPLRPHARHKGGLADLLEVLQWSKAPSMSAPRAVTVAGGASWGAVIVDARRWSQQVAPDEVEALIVHGAPVLLVTNDPSPELRDLASDIFEFPAIPKLGKR